MMAIPKKLLQAGVRDSMDASNRLHNITFFMEVSDR